MFVSLLELLYRSPPPGGSSYTFGWRGIDYGKRGFLFFASQSRSSVGVANPPPKVLRDRGGSSSLIQKCLPPFSIPERVIAGLGSPFYPFVVKEGHAPPSPDMKRGKSRTKLVSKSERVVNTHPHWVSQLPKTGRPTDERDFDLDTI